MMRLSRPIHIMMMMMMMTGCNICLVGAHATKNNIGNAHTSLSVSSSSLAKPSHRSLLDDQSSTNLPLDLQSSSSPSPVPVPTTTMDNNEHPTNGDSNSIIIQQSFTQTLQIHNATEFTNEELTRYQLLMSSYTDNFGYNISIPYILPSCQVNSQSVTSFIGSGDSSAEQQVHILTMTFTMGYDGRYYGYDDIDNYPTLFQQYVNSHLDMVTMDMSDRWILPVLLAQKIVEVGVEEETVLPTVEVVEMDDDDGTTLSDAPVTAAPTSSPIAAKVVIDNAPASMNTPTHAPTPIKDSMTNQLQDTPSSSVSTSSGHSTAPPMPSSSLSSSSSTPSSSSSSLPPKRTYQVRSTMTLDSISHVMLDNNGELDLVAKEGWILVTQDWIRNATMQYISSSDSKDGTANEVGSEDERSIDVTISLDHYKLLEDEDATTTNRSRMLSSSMQRRKSEFPPSKQIYLRRGLGSQSPGAPVQWDFTSVLSFHSNTESWNANDIVASGFRSVEQRMNYLDSLQNQLNWHDQDDSSRFDSMTLEVEGELITEEATIVDEPSTTTDSVVVSKEVASTETELSSDGREATIIPGLKDMYFYAIAIAAGCALLLLGVFIYWKRRVKKGRSVSIENDASSPINEVAGQKGARSDDNSTMETPTTEGQNVITSGLLGFLSRLAGKESEDGDATAGSSSDDNNNFIKVVAPSGKLGLVVSSSPDKDTMPMIVQLKNKSVLAGKAKVGDLLLLVDEVDCRGMTALEVSNLIASRSQQPERVFVLSRG